MSQDVKRYIADCIECVKHGPATRFQPLHFILVSFPFQFLGMDFIGSLNATKRKNSFDFNRFVVPLATKSTNVETSFDVFDYIYLFTERLTPSTVTVASILIMKK